MRLPFVYLQEKQRAKEIAEAARRRALEAQLLEKKEEEKARQRLEKIHEFKQKKVLCIGMPFIQPVSAVDIDSASRWSWREFGDACSSRQKIRPVPAWDCGDGSGGVNVCWRLPST